MSDVALQDALALIGERAGSAAQAGRLDDDVVAALRATGVHRTLLPAVFGGREADPCELFDTIAQIGAVDGSAAWCTAIGAGAGVFAGYVNETHAAEIYADPDDPGAGMFAPLGVAVRDDADKATLNGRWPFASNCLHARWIGLGAFVEDAGGVREPIPRLVVVPVADLQIEHTWHSAGLRATGSHHVRADSVTIDLGDSCTFADRAWPNGPLWRMPLFTVLGPVLVGAPIGVARGALEEVQRMVHDGAAGMRGPLAADPVGLAELAAAEGALGAAEAGIVDATRLVWEAAVGGQRASRQLQARVFLAVHNGLDTAVEVTSVAHRLGGGSAAYEGHRLLTALSDVHAARQHVMFAHQHRPALARISAGFDEMAPPFVI
jgi:alkylation response protein AidB-like acyl-CoA dehydrogenase